MMSAKPTPSQTAGPYVHIGCVPNHAGLAAPWEQDLGAVMRSGPVRGQEITLAGTLRDGLGAPVTDALVEIWQADADGLFPGPSETRGSADPNFTGFGRAATDATGGYRFETVKPGRVPWHDGTLQAPHVTLWIVARGVNIALQTRAYFADEDSANAEDPVLARIAPAFRAETLLARPEDDGAYRFDIRLQGEGETVFLDI